MRQDFGRLSEGEKKTVTDGNYGGGGGDSVVDKVFERYLTLMNCFVDPDVGTVEKISESKDKHPLLQSPQMFSFYLFKIAEDKSTPSTFSKKRSAFKKYKTK